jgi:hypothetical protein
MMLLYLWNPSRSSGPGGTAVRNWKSVVSMPSLRFPCFHSAGCGTMVGLPSLMTPCFREATLSIGTVQPLVQSKIRHSKKSSAFPSGAMPGQSQYLHTGTPLLSKKPSQKFYYRTWATLLAHAGLQFVDSKAIWYVIRHALAHLCLSATGKSPTRQHPSLPSFAFDF